MRAILIDDETNCLVMLSLLLKRYCLNVEIIGQFDKPRLAVQCIKDLKPDLVFLDVDMPELTGFDVLDSCKDIPFHVIFTTAHNQYALKAIKYSAIDYLLKPIDREELITAVQKAQQHTPQYQAQQRDILLDYVNVAQSLKEKIALPTSDGLVFIEIKDIVLCESEGNYTKIHLSQGRAAIYTKHLKDIEELLHGQSFFRVHHSYLINLKQVVQYIRTDGGEVKMSNGKHIPISRQKKQDILDALSRL